MFFIPGIVIAILTFPGVIVHEAGHRLFCHLARVPVYETCYFRFGNPAGYVIHEQVHSYWAAFLISVAPFITNTTVALLIFAVAVNVSSNLVAYPLYWLGLSIGMHSFPSGEDANNLWSYSKRSFRYNPLAILGFPVVILIKIANVLSRVWFDLFYSFGLLLLVSSVLSK